MTKVAINFLKTFLWKFLTAKLISKISKIKACSTQVIQHIKIMAIVSKILCNNNNNNYYYCYYLKIKKQTQATFLNM